MEIHLDSNVSEIKIWWKESDPGSAYSEPYLIPQQGLEACSKDVRAALKALNNYARGNLYLNEALDPGWTEYKLLMDQLQWHGGRLRAALIDAGDSRELSQQFAERLNQTTQDEIVTFHCGARIATFPIGYVFEGDPRPPAGRPCRADFDGFWINRMRPGIRLGGNVCRTNIALQGDDFRAVFALHAPHTEFVLAELERAGLHREREQFRRLTQISQRDHYSWNDVTNACDKIVNNDAIYFVFAHCDQDSLFLDTTDRKIWNRFSELVGRRGAASVGLIIFNCCSSAVGTTGGTLLAAGAHKRFCGLIGTEAEIHSIGALRCGIRLMWNLCAEKMTLGDAFDDMQNAPELFPTNLLYTCYAARNFRLNKPIVSNDFGEAA